MNENETDEVVGEAADQKKLKRKEIMQRLHERTQLEDIAFILSSVQGRRFYWRLLGECGIFTTSMTGNNTTFFNEGKRQIGLVMLANLNDADPSAYLKMMQEAKKPEQQ